MESRQPGPMAPRGTITPTERQAFERIFEEIAARRPATAFSPEVDVTGDGALGQSRYADNSHGHPASGMPTPEKATHARQSVDIIMAAAERTNTYGAGATTAFDELHPLEAVSSASDGAKALLRFPPSLRQAARLALGVIEYDRHTPSTVLRLGETGASTGGKSDRPQRAGDPTRARTPTRSAATNDNDLLGDGDRSVASIAKQVELEARRRDLRRGIEEKMRATTSDFALWDVMEQNVFPLVDRLGIGDRVGSALKKRKGKSARESQALDMHVYGACYPSLLLYGLRLLDTRFATTSPLSLSILPRIKELGLTSYVLGVSTPFYNSLMAIYWKKYGDVTRVLGLLEEMRHAGLYFDDATRDLVRAMWFCFHDFEAGKKGPVLQALMAMPELEDALLTRLRHWTRQVEASIDERQRDVRVQY